MKQRLFLSSPACAFLFLSLLGYPFASTAEPKRDPKIDRQLDQLVTCQGHAEAIDAQLSSIKNLVAASKEATELFRKESAEARTTQIETIKKIYMEIYSSADIEYFIKVCNSPVGKKQLEFSRRALKIAHEMPVARFANRILVLNQADPGQSDKK